MASIAPKPLDLGKLSPSQKIAMISKVMQTLQKESTQQEKEDASSFLARLSTFFEQNIVADLVSQQCIPLCVSLLEKASPRVRYNALWTLTNIASDATQVSSNALCLSSNSLTPIRVPACLNQAVVQAGAVPRVLALLDPSIDAETVTQAVWCLGNIVGDGHEMRDLVVCYSAWHSITVICRSLISFLFLRDTFCTTNRMDR